LAQLDPYCCYNQSTISGQNKEQTLQSQHLITLAMFGRSRYFGLKGLHLNIAIGILAGLDFL
jgi:hypothetical protein